MEKDTQTPATKVADSAAVSTDTPNQPASPAGNNKALWMGTAVGIGSAAIVAALLYAKRRKN